MPIPTEVSHNFPVRDGTNEGFVRGPVSVCPLKASAVSILITSTCPEPMMSIRLIDMI